MRLYLKMILLLAIMAVLQPGELACEMQFALRCWVANRLDDAEMYEQLVEEARLRRRMFHERAS